MWQDAGKGLKGEVKGKGKDKGGKAGCHTRFSSKSSMRQNFRWSTGEEVLKHDTACETCRRQIKGIHKATDTCALRISRQKKDVNQAPLDSLHTCLSRYFKAILDVRCSSIFVAPPLQHYFHQVGKGDGGKVWQCEKSNVFLQNIFCLGKYHVWNIARKYVTYVTVARL